MPRAKPGDLHAEDDLGPPPLVEVGDPQGLGDGVELAARQVAAEPGSQCVRHRVDDAGEEAALELELAGGGDDVLGVEADGDDLGLGLQRPEGEAQATDDEERSEVDDSHDQNSGFTSFFSHRPPQASIRPAAPSITWPRPEENIGLM